MTNPPRIALPIIGILIIIVQIFHIGDHYWGMGDSIWVFLLGVGLIASSFNALRMPIFYILFAGIPIGLGIWAALLWVELFGKGGLSIIGFIAGGWLGIKFVLSDSFDKLLGPISPSRMD